ncbi:MAG: hypothetical protein RQ745_00615 [Longimicrobiales bacterium]|nr:hypothetical protein [Longimicrobiales bacterium]
MIRRCLVCAHDFADNEELEHLSRGERIAFDPGKGRLWVVCTSCRRWTLVPLEDRWEALEELERAAHDRGRLLSETDNIALLRVGSLEVVRVGSAGRREEAWWRYGRELTRRRRHAKKVTVATGIATAGLVASGAASGGLALLGGWFLWQRAPDGLQEAGRWIRFGSTAWRGHATCARCGRAFDAVPFRDRAELLVLPGAESDAPVIGLRCPDCRAWGDEGGLRIEGGEAQRTLQRALAWEHYSGASERRVHAATRLIEEAGSPAALTRILVREGRRLGDLQRTGAIALEIAANEAREQRLLELEVRELEAVWRREEALAEIIDGELTPFPLFRTLRATRSGDSRSEGSE